MTNAYVSSVAWTAVTAWAATTTYSLGQYRRQLAAVSNANARVFKVTAITTGISGGSEPAWNLGNNATTTDGGVTWTQVGGQESEQAAGNWKAPLADVGTAASLFSGSNTVIFVSSDHAQTVASGYSLQPGNFPVCISVSRTGVSLPPTAADDLAGASIATTGASTINIGSIYLRGFTISAGSAANNASISLGNGSTTLTELENCSLILNNTNASSQLQLGSNSNFPSWIRMVNTTITFGAAGQTIAPNNCSNWEWSDTPSALAGTVPTVLITQQSNVPSRSVKLHGLDLSTLNTTLISSASILSQYHLWDCKLNASLTITAANLCVNPDTWIRLDNCDDSTSASNYKLYRQTFAGLMRSRADIAMSGGASDGVTSYGHLVLIQSNNSSLNNVPFVYQSMWLPARYNTTGASKTVTLEAISWGGVLPDNLTLWMEVEALTTAGVPLASLFTTRQGFPFGSGSNNTTTTTDWTAGAAARQNSHAYNIGDVMKVASNPTRLFLATAASGNTAGSEPAGLATCIDGGTVVDGSVTWQAGWRIKFSLSITPQMAGIVRARVCAAMSTGKYFAYNPNIAIA